MNDNTLHFTSMFTETGFVFAPFNCEEKSILFPKEKARWEGEYVHERLTLDDDVSVKHVDGDLLHFSIKNKADHLARARSYAKLAAQKMQAEGKRFSYVKYYFSPTSRFIKMYVFKLGFLDGQTGWQVCKVSALAVRWRWEALRALNSEP